jgi:hypothetical protein
VNARQSITRWKLTRLWHRELEQTVADVADGRGIESEDSGELFKSSQCCGRIALPPRPKDNRGKTIFNRGIERCLRCDLRPPPKEENQDVVFRYRSQVLQFAVQSSKLRGA